MNPKPQKIIIKHNSYTGTNFTDTGMHATHFIDDGLFDFHLYMSESNGKITIDVISYHLENAEQYNPNIGSYAFECKKFKTLKEIELQLTKDIKRINEEPVSSIYLHKSAILKVEKRSFFWKHEVFFLFFNILISKRFNGFADEDPRYNYEYVYPNET